MTSNEGIESSAQPIISRYDLDTPTTLVGKSKPTRGLVLLKE